MEWGSAANSRPLVAKAMRDRSDSSPSPATRYRYLEVRRQTASIVAGSFTFHYLPPPPRGRSPQHADVVLHVCGGHQVAVDGMERAVLEPGASREIGDVFPSQPHRDPGQAGLFPATEDPARRFRGRCPAGGVLPWARQGIE